MLETATGTILELNRVAFFLLILGIPTSASMAITLFASEKASTENKLR